MKAEFAGVDGYERWVYARAKKPVGGLHVLTDSDAVLVRYQRGYLSIDESMPKISDIRGQSADFETWRGEVVARVLRMRSMVDRVARTAALADRMAMDAFWEFAKSGRGPER